jgi:hypothetical protein
VEHGTGVRTRRCPDPSPPRWQPPVAAPGSRSGRSWWPRSRAAGPGCCRATPPAVPGD